MQSQPRRPLPSDPEATDAPGNSCRLPNAIASTEIALATIKTTLGKEMLEATIVGQGWFSDIEPCKHGAMRRLILLTLMSAACLPAASSAEGGTLLKARPAAPVGLCVRTARDGYVVLEARLMRSSGDPKVDTRALKDVIGSPVPIPNQRMWFEWTPMEVDYGPASEQEPDKTMPDCSPLEIAARAKAGAR